MKKLFLSIFAALLCALAAVPANAAAGDLQVESYFEHDGAMDMLGTAFYRAGSLWVPAQQLKVMGVEIDDGPNGKGFIIEVDNPAQAFDAPALAELAGPALNLYFPSFVVSGIAYFNVTGLQDLLKLSFRREGDKIIFSRIQPQRAYAASAPRLPAQGGRLTMTWEHVTTLNPDLGAMQKIAGLDVISPTWFNLMDASGGCANRGARAYSDSAHAKGYQMWALVSNSFSGQLTTNFFRSARGMNLFIARLAAYARIYDLDGYNIDFEGINDTHRDAFTRFVQSAYSVLSPMGLKLSVDVLIPSSKSRSAMAYNRGELAKYTDYVMLMAYDEHWRTSQTSGSVASLPWVTRAVENSLAEGVPASKLVLGVPFYMRRWEETPNGGKPKVKSMTLTMAAAEELIAKTGAAVQWLEEPAQHYFAYSSGGRTYKVWVENAASIGKKLELVVKYELAGMAGWRRGHEKADVWQTISQMMGKGARR